MGGDGAENGVALSRRHRLSWMGERAHVDMGPSAFSSSLVLTRLEVSTSYAPSLLYYTDIWIVSTPYI